MTDFNNEDPLLNLTLETDDLGIWLIDDRPEGSQQLGCISWRVVTQGVQSTLLKEKFLMALAKMDEEDGWFDD